MAMIARVLALSSMFVGVMARRADLNDCFEMLEGAEAPIFCAASTARELDACFLQCGFCTVPALRSGISATDRAIYCDKNHSNLDFDREKLGSLAANALINVSAAHGYFWARPESNSTAALAHLFSYMSRADLQVLFTQPFLMLDYLHEHVTFATAARGGGILVNVTDELWLEYVVPFGFMDEKRDLFWRWRPTFHRTFSTAEDFTNAKTITEAVKGLALLIPKAAMAGVTALERGNGDREFISGNPVTWHSGSSPLDMSAQQIVQHGGSCTGTAILLAAVLRSVGIPARVTGCSTELPDNDNDHHWVEYFDPTDAGPFGDFWHTKEGVSKGNAGGPWDGASGPMNGCMKGLKAKSSLDMLWSGSWSAPRYMPTLWGESDWAAAQRWKGGIPRCAAYCAVWGCGPNQTKEGWEGCEPPIP